MYLMIALIISMTIALFIITESTFQRTTTLLFGIGGTLVIITLKIIGSRIKRRMSLMFGPVERQLVNLKRQTKSEYPGVFTLIDVFGNSSSFKYTPLRSQQPPIAKYMIFYKDDILAVLTVHNKHEDHYDMESYGTYAETYSTIEYAVLHHKVLNRILSEKI